MRMPHAALAIALVAVGCGGERAHAEGRASLELVQTIPVADFEGRIDHMALDAARKRLVVAGLGANALVVIDLEKGTVAKRLTGLAAPQGVLVLPDDGAIVTSCGRDATMRWFDGTTFEPSGVLDLGEDADNLRWDGVGKRIVVGYAERLGFVEGRKLVASTALAGHPEGFQVDAKGDAVWVNVPEGMAIQSVDRTKATLRATWPLKTDRANYPMALDEPHARLFVGCREPAVLLVFDTATSKGEPLARVPISKDVDDLFLDDASHLLYASCGEGFLDVIERRPKDEFVRLDRVATGPGARTCLFDPATGTLFVALPHRSSATAEIRLYRHQK